MSETKVKRLVRLYNINYDTNQGSYIFPRQDFERVYASKMNSASVKKAVKTKKTIDNRVKEIRDATGCSHDDALIIISDEAEAKKKARADKRLATKASGKK